MLCLIPTDTVFPSSFTLFPFSQPAAAKALRTSPRWSSCLYCACSNPSDPEIHSNFLLRAQLLKHPAATGLSYPPGLVFYGSHAVPFVAQPGSPWTACKHSIISHIHPVPSALPVSHTPTCIKLPLEHLCAHTHTHTQILA